LAPLEITVGSTCEDKGEVSLAKALDCLHMVIFKIIHQGRNYGYTILIYHVQTCWYRVFFIEICRFYYTYKKIKQIAIIRHKRMYIHVFINYNL
jgi:hypothetical protein